MEPKDFLPLGSVVISLASLCLAYFVVYRSSLRTLRQSQRLALTQLRLDLVKLSADTRAAAEAHSLNIGYVLVQYTELRDKVPGLGSDQMLNLLRTEVERCRDDVALLIQEAENSTKSINSAWGFMDEDRIGQYQLKLLDLIGSAYRLSATAKSGIWEARINAFQDRLNKVLPINPIAHRVDDA